jgi:hypothetical protein
VLLVEDRQLNRDRRQLGKLAPAPP